MRIPSRRHSLIAAMAIAILGAGVALGSLVLPGGTSTQTVQPVKPAGLPISKLGATVTLTGRNGAELAVTLQQVLRGSGGNASTIALDMRFTNVGRTKATVRPATEALALDSAGRSIPHRGGTSFAGCHVFGTGAFALAPQSTVEGCVLVEASGSSAIARAEFVPTDKHFPQHTAAVWSVS